MTSRLPIATRLQIPSCIVTASCASVIRSWLLELLESAFGQDATLSEIKGVVEDSGEGRWTLLQAIESDVPADIIALSLFRRFRSRQKDAFTDKVIAALRKEFGGHAVTAAEKQKA